jgi:hypothetical protein
LKRRFHAILVAAFVFTLVFACVAGAQETTLESDDGATAEPQDDTGQQPLGFAAVLLGLSFTASGLWILGSVIRRDA